MMQNTAYDFTAARASENWFRVPHTMNVLLVDDHPLFREALSHLVRQLNPAALTLQAASAREALELVRSTHDLALALFDLNLPGEDGIAALSQCRTLCPDLPMVVVSSSESVLDQRRAFDAGARGYIVKTTPGEAIVSALRGVLAGEPYFPSAPFDKQPPAGEGLTLRQMEVLLLMCEGRSNKDIANHLNITEQTVKVHVGAVFRVLKVVSRTQAIVAARQLGLGKG